MLSSPLPTHASFVLAVTALATIVALSSFACDTAVHRPDDGPISASCREARDHADFEWVRDNVFAVSCAAFSACHRGSRPPADLSLAREVAHRELVGVPATGVDGWVRVVPGQPEVSYLMVKIGGIEGPLGDGGDYMPPNSPLLCDEKIDAVRRWIAAGAPGGGLDAGVPDAATTD